VLKAGRSRVRDPMRSLDCFPIDLILPAAVALGVHSASNRDEYHKQKKIVFLGSRCVQLTSVSRLSRQCGILNISQPYRPDSFTSFTVGYLHLAKRGPRLTGSYGGQSPREWVGGSKQVPCPACSILPPEGFMKHQQLLDHSRTVQGSSQHWHEPFTGPYPQPD
jgi:hypothetical protein